MCVDDGVAELAHRKLGPLCERLREQGVGREIERDPERDIAGALGEVDVYSSVLDVYHERVVTRWERRDGRVGGVPGVHHHPSRVRVLTERVEDVADLVEHAALGAVRGGLDAHPAVRVVRPRLAVERRVVVRHGESSPEAAVRGVETSRVVGPGVPDLRLLAQRADVLLTGEVPEHLVDERVPPVAVHPLRGEKREPRGEVDGVVCAERRDRVHAGPIRLVCARGERVGDEVVVLSHCGV